MATSASKRKSDKYAIRGLALQTFPLHRARLHAAGLVRLDWLRSHIDFAGEECLIWPFPRRKDGYGSLQVERVTQLAHRAMCGFAHGPAPTDKPHALHSCNRGKEGCVNPRHLRWGTPAENAADAARDGMIHRGEQQHSAKLTEADVRQIRRLRSEGMPLGRIASRFNVCRETIGLVCRGATWGHVK